MVNFVESEQYTHLDPEDPDTQSLIASVRWYSPAFSPKDVPRFYDLSAFTENPSIFPKIITILAERYGTTQSVDRPTHVVGFDARGFILGAPLAVALKVPFVMCRKAQKLPGCLVESCSYHTEYSEVGSETMSLRRDSVPKGANVILIDDLLATGGTAISGIQLIQAVGATVREFVVLIGLPLLHGVERIRQQYSEIPILMLLMDHCIGQDTCGDGKPEDGGKNRVVHCSTLSGGVLPSK